MLKKYILLFAFAFLPFSFVSAQDDPVAFFKQIREATYSLLPESFQGQLTGRLIDDKIRTIPRDYVDAGKTAFVSLSFSKTAGVTVEVKNVDELYKDMFEQYVRFFTLGPILSTRTGDADLARYDYKFTQQSGSVVVLSVQLKNSENRFEIYVDKTLSQILRADYFVGTEMMSSVIIVYQKFTKNGKEYNIPVKFLVKTFDGGESLPQVFEIKNVTIN